jgi:hypothetical protein
MNDDLVKKIELAEGLKDKLDQVVEPTWEKRGISTEVFATDLKNNLDKLNDLLKSGQGDTSIVKSTIKDTFEFISWALVTKEIHNTKSLIDAHVVREKLNGSSKKRTLKRG